MKNEKVAVVTGGTKGIGRAMVDLLVSNGYKVYTTARKSIEISEQVTVFEVDMSKKEEVLAFGKSVNALESHIDILVNNVGTYIPGKITEEEDGTLEYQINTNLASAYHTTRALVELVKKSSKGHIFTICSTASIMPYVNGGSYCISKYGLLGFTKVLREEMKPFRVKVSAVLPGATLTSSWEGTDLPPERFIHPKSVAELMWSAYQLPDHSVMEEILIRPMDGDIH